MKLLFLIVPASGHINACNHICELLQNRGFNLSFLVFDSEGFSLTPHISKIKFTEKSFINLFGNSIPQPEKRSFSWLDNFFNYLANRKVISLKKRIDSLSDILKRYSPDLFLVDSFCSYMYLLIPEFQHKTVFINTQLNNYRDKWVPPLNTVLYPGVARFFLKHKVFWALSNIEKMIMPWRLFGQDDWSIAKKIARSENNKLPHILRKNKSFHPGIKGVPELILGYQSLDLPRISFPVPQYYLATQIDFSRKINPGDDTIYENLNNLKSSLKKKMIYFCLGTIANIHNIDSSLKLIAILFELLKHHPEWHLVVSLQALPSDKLPLPPENVSIYKNVPQLKILPLFDMMITHAGANSVYECIYGEVPMLAFPLNFYWDQGGNAARIVFHRLGKMANIQHIKIKPLEQLIISIFENDEFKANIKKMKQKFLDEYNPEKVIDLIFHYSSKPGRLMP